MTLQPPSSLVSSSAPLLPDSILGVLGGGQLGKMFCAAAQRMGYRVWVLDPDLYCPASVIADRHICAQYDDRMALETLAFNCKAVTTEFENVPASTLAFLAHHCAVSPSAEAVSTVQHRWKEKTFLRDHGFPTAPFWNIESPDHIHAVPDTAFPAILKVSRLGYDGKGQCTIYEKQELVSAWEKMEQVPCILEKRLRLDQEVSVMVARSYNGETITWPVAENIHQEGILETSIIPARIPETLAAQAREYAVNIAGALNYAGILGVEFFIADHQLYINELAPRPHNSGHYTIEASTTSQFEQQVRILCNLPLGNTDLLVPAVMLNLLGDLWLPTAPDWPKILAQPGIKLHLYGKHHPHPKRKMGHLTCLASSLEQALANMDNARNSLGIKPLI